MPGRVLVVEDVRTQAQFLKRLLELDGHEVAVSPDADSAFDELARGGWDLVLTDMVLDDHDGITLFRRINEMLGEDAPYVAILTAYGTVESAREALKAGVYDFLTKPVDRRDLQVLVKNALEHRRLRRENRELSQAVAAREVEEGIVGRSPAFAAALDLAKAAAPSEATILIRGESGAGKEMFAELIHASSTRGSKPLIKVNCGAIPEQLLEAELFGHEQGAFTDAHQARRGRFELANGGTIFLDEIGDMSPTLQVKLLRVLQERELERLGGQGTVIPLDVRLIAATNRDLEALIEDGAFREDLYYRINVISIHCPPLRERRGDIELLANHFRKRFNDKNRKAFQGVSEEALELMRRYAWPGNVRELENVVERAIVLGRDELIRPEHLPPNVRKAVANADGSGDLLERVLDSGLGLEALGRVLIERALEHSDGNVSQAARQLGLTRRTLQYRMDRDGLKR